MPENTDITKMKVADLKRELKLRGLATTGNKTELMERLQASLIDGEFSLDDTAISGEDLLEDVDTELTDEEAKILDENELLKSPRREKNHSTDLLQNDDLPGIGSQTLNNEVTAPKKIVLKRKISVSLLNTETNENKTPIVESAKQENNTSPVQSKRNKINATNEEKSDGTKVVALGEVKKVSQLTAQERLELRAKKFGLKASAANTEMAAVKNVESKPSVNNRIETKLDDEKQAELLKKRAERFGCVVSPKMVQLNEEERLKKRQERFGGGANTTTTTTTPTSGVKTNSSDDWAEKARLRQLRFQSTGVTVNK